MIYQVEINNVVTLVEAESPEEARQKAINDFVGHVIVKEATEDDIAWYKAMSGGE